MNDVADGEAFYTGVSATEEQEHRMRGAGLNLAAARLGLRLRGSQETVHACALAAGLPEIPGYYGYDFTARQFIRAPYPEAELAAFAKAHAS